MAERGLRELSPGRDLINVRVPEDLTAQSKAAVFEIEVQVDPGLSPLDINVSAAIRGLMETHIT